MGLVLRKQNKTKNPLPEAKLYFLIYMYLKHYLWITLKGVLYFFLRINSILFWGLCMWVNPDSCAIKGLWYFRMVVLTYRSYEIHCFINNLVDSFKCN